MLAYSGHFKRERERDMVICDGRYTDWNWKAFTGVLDAWQLRGGKIHHELDDKDLGEWIMHIDNVWLKKIQNPEIWTRTVVDTSHLKHDPRAWRAVLEGFPGVGADTSYQIADYCDDLKTALLWMSDPGELGLKGVGKPTKEKWHKFMGLSEGEVMIVTDKTQPLQPDKSPAEILELLGLEKELA